MSLYKYILKIGAVSREVFPANIAGSSISYDLAEDNRFSYGKKFSKKIVLRGDNFKFIYDFENSVNRCEFIELDILRKCGTDFAAFETARINMVNADIDPDRCEATLKLDMATPYDCYDDNKKIEVNLFEKITTLRLAKIIRGTLEYVSYTSSARRDFFKASAFTEANPETKGWALYWYYRPNSASPFEYKYAREKLIVTCPETLPSNEWILLEDRCGIDNTRVYVRQCLLHNKILVSNDGGGGDAGGGRRDSVYFPEDHPGNMFTSMVLGGAESGITQIDNGFLLRDVLAWFANEYCGKPVQSNLFQINNDIPFNIAYPELPAKKTFENILYQKSDVKRPVDFANATKALITWAKLIDALCNTYNLKFAVDDNFFRIEHVSYFSRYQGLDTTLPKYSRFKQSKKYSYATESLPEQEVFEMMEQHFADFTGVPIEYKGACFEKGKKENIRTEIITTDAQWCLNSGIRDADGNDNGKVSDDGFVLMACEKVGTDYFILRENGILESRHRLNNSLSWAHLHRDYWKWERPQKRGYLNNALTVFKTTKPVKKGEKITVPFCCTDGLKITDYVKTVLGDAIIGNAVYNLFAETLEISPLYRSEVVAFICSAPVSFTFDHRDGNNLYFNTQFTDSLTYTTELQWQFAGSGVWNSMATVTEGNGIAAVNIGTLVEGSYIFRKKVICDFGHSEWSATVTVNVPPMTCTGVPTMQYTDYTSTNSCFHFKIPSIDYLHQVEILVQRPDGVSFYAEPFGFITVMGAYTFIKVYKEKIPYQIGPTHGLYKFQFRWKCAEGLYGPLSSVINVNL